MIRVNTALNPFRMRLSERGPVNLSVELVNDSKEPKILTLNVLLGKQLSFEKSGYRTEIIEKIENLAPGDRKRFYYDVFPKAGTRNEEQPIEVNVEEHYRNFGYITKEYKKRVVLKVED